MSPRKSVISKEVAVHEMAKSVSGSKGEEVCCLDCLELEVEGRCDVTLELDDCVGLTVSPKNLSSFSVLRFLTVEKSLSNEGFDTIAAIELSCDDLVTIAIL